LNFNAFDDRQLAELSRTKHIDYYTFKNMLTEIRKRKSTNDNLMKALGTLLHYIDIRSLRDIVGDAVGDAELIIIKDLMPFFIDEHTSTYDMIKSYETRANKFKGTISRIIKLAESKGIENPLELIRQLFFDRKNIKLLDTFPDQIIDLMESASHKSTNLADIIVYMDDALSGPSGIKHCLSGVWNAVSVEN